MGNKTGAGKYVQMRKWIKFSAVAGSKGRGALADSVGIQWALIMEPVSANGFLTGLLAPVKTRPPTTSVEPIWAFIFVGEQCARGRGRGECYRWSIHQDQSQVILSVSPLTSKGLRFPLSFTGL